MEFLVTVAEFSLWLLLIVLFGFLSVVVFEAWRRRHSNVSVETVTTLDDPKSIKPVTSD
jgi:dolichyl-phosphate beta-glucosyltransferase